MKSNIKAVIFDMDGVIIDSEPIHSQSWEILLKEYKIKPQFTSSGLIHEVGPVGNDTYRAIMERHNLKEELEIVRRKRRQIFYDLIKTKGSLIEGVLKLIKLLKKENIKLAVASNRIIESVYFIIETLGIKNFFEVIIGRDSEIKPKPAPDIFLKTASAIGVKPNECLVLEDSETGVLSAKAAGMKVIAIPNKFTNHQNFSKADKIVNSLNEVTISLLQSLG